MVALVNGVPYEGMSTVLDRVAESLAVARSEGINEFLITIEGITEEKEG